LSVLCPQYCWWSCCTYFLVFSTQEDLCMKRKHVATFWDKVHPSFPLCFTEMMTETQDADVCLLVLPQVLDRLLCSYLYPILGTKGSPWELWVGSWVTSIHDECDGSDTDTLWDDWCSWGCNHTRFFSVFIFKVFVVVKALSGKLIDIYICWSLRELCPI
jgi:hypothetical protein